MRKMFLRISSILGFISVALGALGAHALRAYLSPQAIDNFETAVKYQFFHALAIFGIAILLHFGRKKTLITAAWLFLAGIICFSGSLYILSTREIHGLSAAWIGPITPLGGLLLMGGWAWIFVSTFFHYERQYKETKS
jgi:uncharacterized membrane protein YgdD (TMEM256/DUF423 family)